MSYKNEYYKISIRRGPDKIIVIHHISLSDSSAIQICYYTMLYIVMHCVLCYKLFKSYSNISLHYVIHNYASYIAINYVACIVIHRGIYRYIDMDDILFHYANSPEPQNIGIK